ncbi:S-layer homology domain-containing protein [Priestia filamentosa]|uniref:S-layer homology domain-containing protein n=1 Tax=Priestia filamentosa TaxID=1402861 RepID=UPI002E1E3288|nr:S-layer homology domain-containing protein [Priestia filamentosa]
MNRLSLCLTISFAVFMLVSPFSTQRAEASSNVNKNIMGDSVLTASQMAAFVHSKNSSNIHLYGITVEELAQLFLIAGKHEGVRGDVAFVQALKETGYFKYGGDVVPEQNNYAGIGTTGGGVKGHYFDTPATGVYAQIQHLKAYASKEPLNTPLVDPRYKYVTKGIAPTWPDLQGRWAMQPRGNYGDDILSIYKEMQDFASKMKPPVENEGSITLPSKDPNPFPSDVSKNNEAYEAVQFFLKNDVIDGYDIDGKVYVKPYDNITRYQFVKILVQALGLEKDGDASTFIDVNPHDEDYVYLETAASLGIVKGSDGKFMPYEKIKREHIAAMIYRATAQLLDYNQYSGQEKAFKDVNISSEFYEAISKSSAAGVINGFSETEFGPTKYATRAQGIMMIYRVMKKINEQANS